MRIAFDINVLTDAISTRVDYETARLCLSWQLLMKRQAE